MLLSSFKTSVILNCLLEKYKNPKFGTQTLYNLAPFTFIFLPLCCTESVLQPNFLNTFCQSISHITSVPIMSYFSTTAIKIIPNLNGSVIGTNCLKRNSQQALKFYIHIYSEFHI